MKSFSQAREQLIEPYQNNLNLYAPVYDDRIDLKAAYWAALPKNDNNLFLGNVASFGFSPENNSDSYAWWLPDTLEEYQIWNDPERVSEFSFSAWLNEHIWMDYRHLPESEHPPYKLIV